MLKSLRFVLVLSLLLPLAQAGVADARPTSSSFKSGFSSVSKSSSSAATKSKSSFGSFARKSAPAPAPADSGAAASKPSGGFGTFGGATGSPQRSDSALSRKLDQDAAQANALRTLDARRQAQNQAQNAGVTRPVPGYEQPAPGQPAGMQAPVPAPAQAPIIVRQDSGIGNVIAGAVLANAAHHAHAGNDYPSSGGANTGSAGSGAGAAAGGSALGGFLHLVLWLCVLSLVGWGIYFAWRRVQRRREANKPNYSFERN